MAGAVVRSGVDWRGYDWCGMVTALTHLTDLIWSCVVVEVAVNYCVAIS